MNRAVGLERKTLKWARKAFGLTQSELGKMVVPRTDAYQSGGTGATHIFAASAGGY